MAMSADMKIGEFGRKVGVAPKTVRYYEECGLLPEPVRLANGYRVYGDEDVRRLQFIRSAQAAGLSLRAVSDLLEVVDEGASPCSLTRALAKERIEEIDRQIRTLERLRSRLEALIDPVESGLSYEDATAVCPLIGA
ncbi:heavy metal-responsive transcriptional regulator [soil metagenome]